METELRVKRRRAQSPNEKQHTAPPKDGRTHYISPTHILNYLIKIIARGNLVVAGSWYRAGVGNVDPGGPLFCKV